MLLPAGAGSGAWMPASRNGRATPVTTPWNRPGAVAARVGLVDVADGRSRHGERRHADAHPLEAFQLVVRAGGSGERGRRAEPRWAAVCPGAASCVIDDGEVSCVTGGCSGSLRGTNSATVPVTCTRAVNAAVDRRRARREDEDAFGRGRVGVDVGVVSWMKKPSDLHAGDNAAGRHGGADDRRRGAGALDVVDRASASSLSIVPVALPVGRPSLR